MKAKLKKPGIALARFIGYVITFIVLQALLDFLLRDVIPGTRVKRILDFEQYIRATYIILVGYVLVNSFARFVYWSVRQKYGHAEATMIQNLVKIIGLGSILVGITGTISGEATGIAIGGFMGMVIGFASQQVLSQALAGLFILLTKPIRIGEQVNIGGIEGIVENITMLYTHIRQNNGHLVLMPNNKILGQKIVKIHT